MSYLWVALGGAFGAMSRVFLARFMPASFLSLPARMLLINILGCFLIGLLTKAMDLHWPATTQLRSLIVQGFLASFTTFSAFALEFGILYEKGEHLSAISYVILTVAFSLAFYLLGLRLGRLF